jgi:hypothetical protein
MAIDRIGKSGAPLPPQPEGATGPSAPGKPFEVRSETLETVSKVAPPVTATTPLEKLRAGHVDLNGYLDLKVDEATHHLHGLQLSELDAVRKMLRDQLRNDPTISELVRSATGHLPTPSSDDE